MRGRRILAGVIALALLGGVAMSDEQKGAMTEADMEEAVRHARPGPHHAHLAELAGEWDVAGQSWTDPDPSKPPVESAGRATMRTILGGRFLIEEYRGPEFMGAPFETFGSFGYDGRSDEHIGILMDTLGTFHMEVRGRCEGEGCKTITLTGGWKDHKGRQFGWRMVRTRVDADRLVVTGHATMPPEMLPPGAPREMKCTELTYTRKSK